MKNLLLFVIKRIIIVILLFYYIPINYTNNIITIKKQFNSQTSLTNNDELTTNNDELTTNNNELTTNNDELTTNNDELITNNDELITNNDELTTDLSLIKNALIIIEKNYLLPQKLDLNTITAYLWEILSNKYSNNIPKYNDNFSKLNTTNQQLSAKKLQTKYNFSINLFLYAKNILLYAQKNNINLTNISYDILRGISDKLDPHTLFLPPEDFLALKNSTQGLFNGFGFSLDLRSFLPVITEITSNSPAMSAGIMIGDQILKINNLYANLYNNDDLLNLLKDTNKDINILIFRPNINQKKSFKISKNFIISNLIETNFINNILYIKIPSFSENLTIDLIKEYEIYKKRYFIKGIVIDLRNNPGGLLDEAILLSNLFLKSGKILNIKTKNTFNAEIVKNNNYKIKEKLVILINSSTASASEIFTAAMKDYNRAYIIGEKSFGKGSVQSLFELKDKSAIKLTIAEYLSPHNNIIQSKGIIPHLYVKTIDTSNNNFAWIFGASEDNEEADLPEHFENNNNLPQNMHNIKYIYSENNTKFSNNNFSNNNFIYPYALSFNPINIKDDNLLRIASVYLNNISKLNDNEFLNFIQKNENKYINNKYLNLLQKISNLKFNNKKNNSLSLKCHNNKCEIICLDSNNNCHNILNNKQVFAKISNSNKLHDVSGILPLVQENNKYYINIAKNWLLFSKIKNKLEGQINLYLNNEIILYKKIKYDLTKISLNLKITK